MQYSLKNIYLIIFFSLLSMNGFSQDISCNELLNYVEDEGYLIRTNTAPLSTNWLGDIKAYSMVESDPSLYKVSDIINHYKSSGIYVIVATIYHNDILKSSKKYVFCGVPISKWEAFDSSFYLTYSRGEMFHHYIRDYNCNCY